MRSLNICASSLQEDTEDDDIGYNILQVATSGERLMLTDVYRS